MADELRKRRNTIIAASVGAFVLPLAGLVGAMLFYSNDDREAANTVLGAALAGIVFYVLVLVVL
jgi:zinc transporter ZupT